MTHNHVSYDEKFKTKHYLNHNSFYKHQRNPKKLRSKSRSRSRSRSRDKSSFYSKTRVSEHHNSDKSYNDKKHFSYDKREKSKPYSDQYEKDRSHNSYYSSSGVRSFKKLEEKDFYKKGSHFKQKSLHVEKSAQPDKPKEIFTKTNRSKRSGEFEQVILTKTDSSPYKVINRKSRFSDSSNLPEAEVTASEANKIGPPKISEMTLNEIPAYLNFGLNLPEVKPMAFLSPEINTEETQTSYQQHEMDSDNQSITDLNLSYQSSLKEFIPMFEKISYSNLQKKESNRMEIESEFEVDSDDEIDSNNQKDFLQDTKEDIRKISKPSSIFLGHNQNLQDPRRNLCSMLKAEEKLNLVLDLDETLLNSAGIPSKMDLGDFKHIPRELMRIIDELPDGRKILVVLRPYYKEFLEKMSKMYNIFAYSHGRWEYVLKLLDFLDKEEKYFHREIIYKNKGQVDKNTIKMISNLGFSQKEMNKTVIIDDQKFIWAGDSHKVLPSKKFIPLKDYIPTEKYSKYLFLDNNTEKYTLSLKDPQGLNTYAEFNVFSKSSSQLEPLANFLEEIYHDYNLRKLTVPQKDNSLRVETLIETKYKKVIKNFKISIISSSEIRAKMFYHLGTQLGALIVENHKAEFILVDGSIPDPQIKELKELAQKNPLLILISVNWLIECFFVGYRISSRNFRVQNLL